MSRKNIDLNTPEKIFRRQMWIVTWVTLILPPVTGIFMLSFVGVFPFPQVLYPFTDYALIVVSIASIIGLYIAKKFINDIVQIKNSAPEKIRDHYHLNRLALYYFAVLFLYFAIGLVSTLYSLSTLYGFNYPLQKYFISFLGVIPGGLITALPIFFYLTDALGRFLAPGGIHISVAPIKLKLIVLGLFIPVFIDTLLIMYFYDRTGYFSYETIGIWGFLIIIAAIGTVMAWSSFKQSLSPFVLALEMGNNNYTDVIITPRSLDELGLLSQRWHELWLRVLDYEKKLSLENVTLQSDISQRTHELESERTLIEKVMNSAGAIVVVMDNTGHIIRFNPAAEKITGFSFGDLCNQPIWEWLIPPEQVDDVRQVFNNLAHTATDSHYENDLMKQDGSRVLVAWNNSTITDDAGKVQYIISIGIDMSDRQVAQKALEKAKEAAESANVAKSEFLSRMSHELRTPMNAILGFSQLLEIDSENFTSSQKSFINEIIQGGNHLLSLINEVLDLAKIEEGKLEINMKETNATKVLHESISLLNPQAIKSDISIFDSTDKTVDYIVYADPVRLKQICINILSNAIKYNSAKGEVHISVSLEENNLRISVRDTGAGIPIDKLHKLFKPFERLNNSHNNAIEGTGIGLALSKRLIELMDGSIDVSSQPSQGCTFYITIPFIKVIHHKSNIAGVEQQQNTSAQHTHHYRVLYVEDNPANLRLVETALKARTDIDLITAHTGTLGLDMAFSHKLDLIFLDINLPGINGVDIMKKIKQNETTKHIPVIAISANAMPNDIQSGLSAGFDNYLVKPINIKEFLENLQQHLPES